MRVPLCNFFDERSELVALPSKYAALNERILQRRKAGNQRAQLSAGGYASPRAHSVRKSMGPLPHLERFDLRAQPTASGELLRSRA